MTICTDMKKVRLKSICLWVAVGFVLGFLAFKCDWQNLIQIETYGGDPVLQENRRTKHFSERKSTNGLDSTTFRMYVHKKRAILHHNGLSHAGKPADGRHRTDGAWYSMTGPVELYVYTAHYDDRKSLQGKPHVRIIAVSELNKDDAVFCFIWYTHGRNITTPAIITEVGMGVYRHLKLFTELIISCPLPHFLVPTHVSITLSRKDGPSFAVPVETGVEMDPPQSIGICVSISYWNHDPNRLIEWIEFQRLMGVQGILIYNNSLNSQSQAVFSYYASHDPNFLQLRQSRNFLSESGELTFHLQMSPVINDCMYRYRKRFISLLVLDLDELLVPYAGYNFMAMVDAIKERHTELSVPHTYAFVNAYFFTNFAPRLSQPVELISMRYTKRVDFSEVGYSAKSIIGSEVCIAMHNHYCWKYTAEYEAPDMYPYIEVETDIAYLHHYKRCHLSTVECRELYMQETEDPRMLDFREPLMKAVNKHRKAMGKSIIA